MTHRSYPHRRAVCEQQRYGFAQPQKRADRRNETVLTGKVSGFPVRTDDLARVVTSAEGTSSLLEISEEPRKNGSGQAQYQREVVIGTKAELLEIRQQGTRKCDAVTRQSWTDRLIVALLGAVALLLGFEVVLDTDIWWHVRAGEWILSHRRVPWLDPFTFASADRPWIDLHWGFQSALALAYRLAGVPGILSLAATVCAAAWLVAFSARLRDWPVAVAGWCWVPALAAHEQPVRSPPRGFLALAHGRIPGTSFPG